MKFNGGVRVSEPLHSGRDCLRYYAYAVRNFDATLITVGGYVLGTQGIEPELREFARAFTALPAVRFETLSESDDYVVRTAEVDGRKWLYVVSLSPREQTIALDPAPPSLRNAVTGDEVPVTAGKALLDLRPYELLSLTENVP